jgi:hypothetical protein
LHFGTLPLKLLAGLPEIDVTKTFLMALSAFALVVSASPAFAGTLTDSHGHALADSHHHALTDGHHHHHYRHHLPVCRLGVSRLGHCRLG